MLFAGLPLTLYDRTARIYLFGSIMSVRKNLSSISA
jgi:hypothetical protein